MTKLHQILALEKTIKTKKDKTLTAAYQLFQAKNPFVGITRNYQPRDEEGEMLPPESQMVQARVGSTLEEVNSTMAAALDLMITKDTANTQASADIVVEGNTLATDVPVTTLLSLEKIMTDIRTTALAIPVLDPTQEWTYDENVDSFRSAARQTTRTQKIPRVQVLYDATPEHPAQVQSYTEDVIVGDWETTNLSGAIPAAEKNEIVERVEAVQRAVKIAREEANSTDAPSVEIGTSLMEYMFGNN